MSCLSRRAAAWIAIMMTLSAFIGCRAAPDRAVTQSPRRPARINHLAFFKLNDPADAAALIEDCDRMAAVIPGITAYYAGQHVDVGRPTVDGDYDVGFYTGFETIDDYLEYVAHPEHVALVERWSPRLQWLRVHDVLDPTP